MSAITQNIELDEPGVGLSNQCQVTFDGLGVRHCLPDLAVTHAGLTRQLWVRRTLEDMYNGTEFKIVTGAEGGTKKKRDELGIVTSRPYQKWDIPWMIDKEEYKSWFSILSVTEKMDCASFDLPPGPTAVGGSCPAALIGQTTVPRNVRVDAAEKLGFLMSPDLELFAICNLCYAEGGNYASPSNQLGGILRLWWTRQMIATDQGRDVWVRTMVDAIRRGEEHISKHDKAIPDPRPEWAAKGHSLRPFRVHSSGDFFSLRYAEAWIMVANQIPDMIFWAPTRSWASAGWEGLEGSTTISAWARLLDPRFLLHRNFIVRPSAYCFGDPAPRADRGFARLRVQPPYPYAAGTTSIYKGGIGAPGAVGIPSRIYGGLDDRYDLQCAVYNQGKGEKKQCTAATITLPDGSSMSPCRVCWTHPHLTVNFMAH